MPPSLFLKHHYAKMNQDEGVNGDNPDIDPTDLLLLSSDISPTPQSSPPPPPPPPKSPFTHSSHCPPRPVPRIWPHTPTGRSQRGRGGRGQLFDDPAVVKTVKGRPSLKVFNIRMLIFIHIFDFGLNSNH